MANTCYSVVVEKCYKDNTVDTAKFGQGQGKERAMMQYEREVQLAKKVVDYINVDLIIVYLLKGKNAIIGCTISPIEKLKK